MSDYRIETKVRNDRILRALEGLGESIPKFCARHGFSASRLFKIVALKASPKNKDGMWHKEIMALCDDCNIMPGELFTERQLTPIEKTRTVVHVSEGQVRAQLADMNRLALDCINPETKVIQSEMLRTLLNTISQRSRTAVELHHDGMTLDEIAEEMGGISKGRVGQIINKAYRDMKMAAWKKYGIKPGNRDSMAEIFGCPE